MNTEQRKIIETHLKPVIVDILLANPSLSLGDIFAAVDSMRTGKVQAVKEVAAAVAAPAEQPAAKVKVAAKAKGKPGRKPKAKAAVVAAAAAAPEASASDRSGASEDLKTKAGRDVYDRRVFEALKDLGGKEVAARAIGAKVGGNEEQVRTSLKRLVAGQLLQITGERSLTRYSLVAK